MYPNTLLAQLVDILFLGGLRGCPIVLMNSPCWWAGSAAAIRWLLGFFFDLTVSQTVIILSCSLIVVQRVKIALWICCGYWRGYELRKILIEDFGIYSSWRVLHENYFCLLLLIICWEVCDINYFFWFCFGLIFLHLNVTENILFVFAFLIKHNHLTRHLFYHTHDYVLDFLSPIILIFIHRETWLLSLLLHHGFLLVTLILTVLLIVCHGTVFSVLSSSTCRTSLWIIFLFRVLFLCLLGSLFMLLWIIVNFFLIRTLFIISMLMQTFHKVVHNVCVGQLGLLLVSLLLALSCLISVSLSGYSIGHYYFRLRHRLWLWLLKLVGLFLLLLLSLGFIRGYRFFIVHILALVLLFLGIFLLLRIVFHLGFLIM